MDTGSGWLDTPVHFTEFCSRMTKWQVSTYQIYLLSMPDCLVGPKARVVAASQDTWLAGDLLQSLMSNWCLVISDHSPPVVLRLPAWLMESFGWLAGAHWSWLAIFKYLSHFIWLVWAVLWCAVGCWLCKILYWAALITSTAYHFLIESK